MSQLQVSAGAWDCCSLPTCPFLGTLPATMQPGPQNSPLYPIHFKVYIKAHLLSPCPTAQTAHPDPESLRWAIHPFLPYLGVMGCILHPPHQVGKTGSSVRQPNKNRAFSSRRFPEIRVKVSTSQWGEPATPVPIKTTVTDHELPVIRNRRI